MADQDLTALAADLEAARVDEAAARKAAARVPAKGSAGRQASALVRGAMDAYAAGRTRQAWAAATVADAAMTSWGERPLQVLRGGANDSVLDLRARALVVLSFIEADEGREVSSSKLRVSSETVLGGMRDSSRTRLAVAVATSERALRQGRANEAVSVMEEVLRNPTLDDSQRAAGQAVLAGALRLAGRQAEGIATLQATAESYARAGRPSAVIDADLERGIHLMQAGDAASARAVLLQVADASATSGHHPAEVEARLRLGRLSAEARRHIESAEQFQLAAAAARRLNDDASIVVALRNAGDELRLGRDLDGAAVVLGEALAIHTTPALEVDQAEAGLVLAAVRQRQGNSDEAARILDDARSTFQRRLDALEHGESAQLRYHLEAKLRQVADLDREIRSG